MHVSSQTETKDGKSLEDRNLIPGTHNPIFCHSADMTYWSPTSNIVGINIIYLFTIVIMCNTLQGLQAIMQTRYSVHMKLYPNRKWSSARSYSEERQGIGMGRPPRKMVRCEWACQNWNVNPCPRPFVYKILQIMSFVLFLNERQNIVLPICLRWHTT